MNNCYLLYALFGIIPSVIWLLFYLRKDVHPESNRMILTVFLLGMLVAPLVAIFECLPTGFDVTGKLNCLLKSFFSQNFPYPYSAILYVFLGIAFVEEVFKYLVVRLTAFRHHELDEPTDVILYMIISALGFAALENILILFQLGPAFLPDQAIGISIIRFLGATFLHTLCSGAFGFFIALSFYKTKKRKIFFLSGLFLSVFAHGLYNFSILNPELIYKPLGVKIEDSEGAKLLIPLIILISLAIFVLLGFRKLQKLKGVCKIN